MSALQAPTLQCYLASMATPQPMESWQRIESLLLDARAHLSQEAEVLCDAEIGEFEEFIGHNELELAFGALVTAFEKATCESWRVLELLALAAASMGLTDRQRELDLRLTEVRGWKYETAWPLQ